MAERWRFAEDVHLNESCISSLCAGEDTFHIDEIEGFPPLPRACNEHATSMQRACNEHATSSAHSRRYFSFILMNATRFLIHLHSAAHTSSLPTPTPL